MSELSEVQWLKDTTACATMTIYNGAVLKKSYDCDFGPRVINFTLTSLTLSEMKSFDDGEFSCTTTPADYSSATVETRFNVIVKGKVLLILRLIIIIAIVVFCGQACLTNVTVQKI